MLPVLNQILHPTRRHGGHRGHGEKIKKDDVVELPGHLVALAATVDHPDENSHQPSSVFSLPSVPPCWVE